MYDTRINLPYKCSTEYGNLSGHSLFASSFNFFVFLDYFHGEYKDKAYSKILYFCMLFLAFALAIVIGFSRIYLNAHTLNQVVYGWTFGFWLAFYFHFCLREPIMKHIEDISERKDYQIPYKKCILFSFIAFILVYMS